MRRGAAALAGLFVGFSIAWISWAVTSTGDWFAQGNRFAIPSLLIASLLGAHVGWRVRSKPLLVVLWIAAALCLAYWVFVPDGWWALPPQQPARLQP